MRTDMLMGCISSTDDLKDRAALITELGYMRLSVARMSEENQRLERELAEAEAFTAQEIMRCTDAEAKLASMEQDTIERCAKVCDELETDMGFGEPAKCAAAIRALTAAERLTAPET